MTRRCEHPLHEPVSFLEVHDAASCHHAEHRHDREPHVEGQIRTSVSRVLHVLVHEMLNGARCTSSDQCRHLALQHKGCELPVRMGMSALLGLNRSTRAVQTPPSTEAETFTCARTTPSNSTSSTACVALTDAPSASTRCTQRASWTCGATNASSLQSYLGIPGDVGEVGVSGGAPAFKALRLFPSDETDLKSAKTTNNTRGASSLSIRCSSVDMLSSLR